MKDESATLAHLRSKVASFIAEREWEPFHHPKDLAISISVEASELLEHFQWEEKRPLDAIRHDGTLVAEVTDEMCDILHYILVMANTLEVDLAQAFDRKMARNAERYPADKSAGDKFLDWRRAVRKNGRVLSDDEL